MQSARIWFQQGRPPFDLVRLKENLEALGLTVRRTEWRFQHIAIPQLHVATDPPFLVQMNDDEYIIEEAEEFAELHKVALTPDAYAKLRTCDARFEIGDGNEAAVTTADGVFSFAGWTSLDPGLPEVRRIFISITTAVDGVFEDNVNGLWWSV